MFLHNAIQNYKKTLLYMTFFLFLKGASETGSPSLCKFYNRIEARFASSLRTDSSSFIVICQQLGSPLSRSDA